MSQRNRKFAAHIQKAEAEEKVSAQSFIIFSSRGKQIFILSQRNYGALKCGFHRGTPQMPKVHKPFSDKCHGCGHGANDDKRRPHLPIRPH